MHGRGKQIIKQQTEANWDLATYGDVAAWLLCVVEIGTSLVFCTSDSKGKKSLWVECPACLRLYINIRNIPAFAHTLGCL